MLNDGEHDHPNPAIQGDPVEATEEGQIEDIPRKEDLVEERTPEPSPKLPVLPKGSVVSPMEGVNVMVEGTG